VYACSWASLMRTGGFPLAFLVSISNRQNSQNRQHQRHGGESQPRDCHRTRSRSHSVSLLLSGHHSAQTLLPGPELGEFMRGLWHLPPPRLMLNSKLRLCHTGKGLRTRTACQLCCSEEGAQLL
jgi:hypothetical protein